MSLPRGVTYKMVAEKFRNGMSIEDIAWWYNRHLRDIEHAIRAVMRRKGKGRT